LDVLFVLGCYRVAFFERCGSDGEVSDLDHVIGRVEVATILLW